MFAQVLEQNLLIREWLNGSLFPLTANLALVIGVYLYQCFYEAKRDGKSWLHVAGIQTACALFWVFGAESVRAVFVWLSLRTKNDGHQLAPFVDQFSTAMLIFAAAVLVAAVLRCTYLFTPPLVMIRGRRFPFRQVFWVYSLAVTVAFVVFSHFYPEYPQFLIN